MNTAQIGQVSHQLFFLYKFTARWLMQCLCFERYTTQSYIYDYNLQAIEKKLSQKYFSHLAGKVELSGTESLMTNLVYSFDIKCSKSSSTDSCNVIQCRWKCGALFHSCKHSEHNMICGKFEDEDEFGWMLRGVTNLDTRGLKKRKKNVVEILKPLNDFFQGPGEPAHKIHKVGNWAVIFQRIIILRTNFFHVTGQNSSTPTSSSQFIQANFS